ncbi:MAG TPA: HEAT repeat domain-containing protein [Candidatus Eisenbacteria bacterium]|nr:HEAT repeat domain-containing protein [Candidatus Eisenbacteria bacterium]
MTAKNAERLWDELRQRDPDAKRAWIERLAKDGTPDSIDLLLAALEQESWFLRDSATRALAGMGEDVVESLIDYLQSGLWYTRAAAATALGAIGLPIAAEPLTALLRDANRTVRDAARDALLLLARQELAAHAVATAFAALSERGQRFALDGLSERDPDVAESIARLMADPSRRAAAEAAAESVHLPRAVNDSSDDLDWEAVTGKRHEPRG